MSARRSSSPAASTRAVSSRSVASRAARGHPRQPDEDDGPLPARRGVLASLVEECGRTLDVAGDVVVVGGIEQPPPPVGRGLAGRQPDGVIGELCGCERCSPGARGVHRLFDDGRHLTIGANGRDRQVACALLLRRRDLRQTSVERPASGVGLACRHRGAEEWVGEAEAILVDLEDARIECLWQSRVGGAAERRADEPDGGLRERRGHGRDLERVRAEPVEALAQKLVQARRDGQRVGRSGGEAAPLERQCELQREEGVAPGRLPEPDERRSWQPSSEAGTEQLVHRADAQPLDRERRQPVGRVRSNEPARHLATDGDERARRAPSRAVRGRT